MLHFVELEVGTVYSVIYFSFAGFIVGFVDFDAEILENGHVFDIDSVDSNKTFRIF